MSLTECWTQEEADLHENVTDQLRVEKHGRYNRIYHNDVCLAILVCPGDYVILQTGKGTLEARRR